MGCIIRITKRGARPLGEHIESTVNAILFNDRAIEAFGFTNRCPTLLDQVALSESVI